MAVIRNRAAEADLTFRVGGLADSLFRVVQFNGHEEISQLFHFTIELASEDAEVDFQAVIGQQAVLAIEGDPSPRFINAIVSRFEQAGRGTDYTRYRAELVPTVWLLSQRQNCRIFQSKSVQDIVTAVLQDAGIPSDAFRFALRGSYAPRDFCCQYRESDMDFIARLMEEEGIGYFFEHSEDAHVLVMADNTDAHPAIADPATVALQAVGYGSTDEEFLSAFTLTREIRSGAVVLRDFNAIKPSLDLTVEKQGDSRPELEVYDYPGSYQETDAGNGFAKVRLEEEQAGVERATGRSDCRRLIAGYTFTLDGHERADFNKEYLITGIHHYGSQPQAVDVEAAAVDGQQVYENDIECIPKATPFRPPRTTPRPVISGSQTAIVTGPGGEEVHTDEHGRVKVHFHWDRLGTQDDTSSCWVRVSQGWAGVGYGIMFLPRIGQEVIVDFLEGDPDRPIITGRVYNGEQVPPYSLPADKTKSTIKSNSSKGGDGANEIRFEDKKGEEELYIHAEKDMNTVVDNNQTLIVGANKQDPGDQTIAIHNDRTETVGHDESISIGNDRTEGVTNDESIDIGNDQTIHVANNRSLTVDANKSESVGQDKSITVSGSHDESVEGAMSVSVGDSRSMTVGKDLSETISGGMTLSVTKDRSTSIGANLTVEVSKDAKLTIGGEQVTSVTKESSLNAKKIQLVADDEISFKTGSATIVMKKSGDITIDGKKITIKGSGDVVIKGSKVAMN